MIVYPTSRKPGLPIKKHHKAISETTDRYTRQLYLACIKYKTIQAGRPPDWVEGGREEKVVALTQTTGFKGISYSKRYNAL